MWTLSLPLTLYLTVGNAYLIVGNAYLIVDLQ
jgi:hypothetical protein